MTRATKFCTKCERETQHIRYSNGTKARGDGKAIRCKRCRSDYSAGNYRTNPEYRQRVRENFIKRKYGITLVEVEALRAAQGAQCPVCDDPLKGGQFEHIDHCHETGVVRGVLCSECNTAIGKLRDDPDLLRRAAAYLESRRMSDVATQL